MSNKKSAAQSYAAKSAARMRVAIIIICAALALLLVGGAVGLISILNDKPIMDEVRDEIDAYEISDFAETDRKTDYVKITVKDHGDIIIRLRDDEAPKTVKNFKKLVDDGFYDGLTFHRIKENFVIQGGDPKGDGTGDSGTTIKGEFSANGHYNDISHIKGVISMARETAADSGSCQFFICNDDASASLDGSYAAFGYVVAGLETVDSISAVEVKDNGSGEKSSPVSPVIIEKVCFVKKG